MNSLRKTFGAMAMLLLGALVVSGCVPNQGAIDEPVPTPQGEFVQDFWVVDSAAALNSDFEWTELIPDITAELIRTEAVKTTPLTENMTFLQYDELKPSLQKIGGTIRDDFDLIGGILDSAGELALAVLATPKKSTTSPITVDDLFRIDVSFMGGIVTPGDPILFDFSLVQALPGFTEAEAKLSGMDLFKHRIDQGHVQYLGLVEGGETYAVKYVDQVGVALQGSDVIGLPGKEAALEDGLRDGIESCAKKIRNPAFGLNCVREFYKDFGLGAIDSWKQINDNLELHEEEPIPGTEPGRGPNPNNKPDPKPNNSGEKRKCGVGEPPHIQSDGSLNCVPPPCTDCDGGGKVVGDPHLLTFDGDMFSMHGIGEFLLADNGIMTVQGRTSQTYRRTEVSSLEEVAFRYGDTVFIVNREKVFVDGKQLTDPAGQFGEHTVFQSMHRVVITNNKDYYFEVTPSVATLELSLSIPKKDNIFTGMLGNNNGVRDDYFSRGATTGSATKPEFDDFYNNYVNSWRITDEESLLLYAAGETTATYTDLNFPSENITSANFPDTERNIAERLCLVRGITSAPFAEACMLDMLVLAELDDMTFVGDLQTLNTMFWTEQISNDWHAEAHKPWGHPRYQKREAREPRDPDGQEFNPGSAEEVIAKSWKLTGQTLANHKLAEVEVVCPASTEFYPVWGGAENVYALDSSVCSAAVHRGFVDPVTGGSIVFMMVEGQYSSSSDIVANGVTAKPKANYEGFQLVRYGAY